MGPRYHRPREIPTVEQLTAELDREIYRSRYRRVLRSTVYALVVVAAVAVLVATIWMPVLQVYGSSMTPTLGECNIALPYQVPECSYFCMGDNRPASVDSRNTVIGCVAEEQIVGKPIFRVWPLDGFGILK